MALEESSNSAKTSKEEFDVVANRISIALAEHDRLIKSWTSSSSLPRQKKTEKELEAEEAELFRTEPLYLGVGAPIPAHFLVSEAQRSNKALRARLFDAKTLRASKARDAEEKAASSKRGLKYDSSDEEQGRSGLGKAKKKKISTSLKNGDPKEASPAELPKALDQENSDPLLKLPKEEAKQSPSKTDRPVDGKEVVEKIEDPATTASNKSKKSAENGPKPDSTSSSLPIDSKPSTNAKSARPAPTTSAPLPKEQPSSEEPDSRTSTSSEAVSETAQKLSEIEKKRLKRKRSRDRKKLKSQKKI